MLFIWLHWFLLKFIKKIKLWYDATHYDGYYLSKHKFNLR